MENEPINATSEEVIVLLVSGTCCVPQLAIVDQQAQQIIGQALKETGTTAQVRMLTISSALSGGIPTEILQSIRVQLDPPDIMRLPAVFINGKLISFGVPNLDAIKNALMNTQK